MRTSMHQHAAASAATAALSVCLGSHAQSLDDCNANGVSDAVEIAQSLASDCDGNGIPDTCDYAGESRLSGVAIEFYLTLAEPASSDVRLYFSGGGDFGDPDEYLGIYLDDQPRPRSGIQAPSSPTRSTPNATCNAWRR